MQLSITDKTFALALGAYLVFITPVEAVTYRIDELPPAPPKRSAGRAFPACRAVVPETPVFACAQTGLFRPTGLQG